MTRRGRDGAFGPGYSGGGTGFYRPLRLRSAHRFTHSPGVTDSGLAFAWPWVGLSAEPQIPVIERGVTVAIAGNGT